MKTAFVRINQINAPALPLTKANTRKISIHINPSGDKNIISLYGTDILTTNYVWSFKYLEEEKYSLLIILTETQSVFQEIEIGKLTLPFSWFQRNSVVRSSFPMKTKLSIQPLVIFLDIHLSEDASNSFNASAGRLWVQPAGNSRCSSPFFKLDSYSEDLDSIELPEKSNQEMILAATPDISDTSINNNDDKLECKNNQNQQHSIYFAPQYPPQFYINPPFISSTSIQQSMVVPQQTILPIQQPIFYHHNSKQFYHHNNKQYYHNNKQ